MAKKMRAVLLQDDPTQHYFGLHQELTVLGTEVRTVGSCAEAAGLLASADPPELILTDVNLSDGNWEDVVRLSQSASQPVNVVVISRLAEIRLYMDVLQSGAFDFISPPCMAPELSHVLRAALSNATQRRLSLASPCRVGGDRPAQPSLALAG